MCHNKDDYDYSYDYEKNCNYHPLNTDPVAIFFILILALLPILGIIYFMYKSSPFIQTTYQTQQAYFNIVNHGYDNNINNWVIGVRDKNNVPVGSFLCKNKPQTAKPVLFYQLTETVSRNGNVDYQYAFNYRENCQKIGKSLSYPRKKGEFVL